MKKAIICSAVFVSTLAFAHEGIDHSKEQVKADPHQMAPQMPKEFDSLKDLAGTWQGTAKMGGKEIPVKVVYELTSGGTAVTEKLMPGTPHEMLSIYYKEGNSLAMTHYCSAGNQPRMKLSKNEGNTMSFKLDGKEGLTSEKEMHMHQMTLTKVDRDNLRAEWVAYENGKAQDPHVFTFKRAK